MARSSMPMRNPVRRLAIVAAIGALLASGCARARADSPADLNIGKSADAATIAREDIDVSPDGSGLPDGNGNAADGAAIFAAACQRCHGIAIRLDSERWPYATTLFDYVRRAMPPDRMRQLSPHEVYAIVAYELRANGVSAAPERLDRRSLPLITMPGVTEFIRVP